MSNLDTFRQLYCALHELFKEGSAQFCEANTKLDPNSIKTKRELIASHDEKWYTKFNEARRFSAKIDQTDEVKQKIQEIENWDNILDSGKRNLEENYRIAENI